MGYFRLIPLGILPKGIPRKERVSLPWVLTGFLAADLLVDLAADLAAGL